VKLKLNVPQGQQPAVNALTFVTIYSLASAVLFAGGIPRGSERRRDRARTLMVQVWSILAPLIVASAVLPAQIVVTLLLARSSLRAAFSWVAGMTTVRLIQGVLFGFVFSSVEAKSDTTSSGLAGGLLLVASLLLYAGAVKKLLAKEAEDEDAPPPKWARRSHPCHRWRPSLWAPDTSRSTQSCGFLR
jgi:hypothetical protein